MRVVEDTATRSSGSLPPSAMPPSSYDLNASLIRPIASDGGRERRTPAGAQRRPDAAARRRRGGVRVVEGAPSSQVDELSCQPGREAAGRLLRWVNAVPTACVAFEPNSSSCGGGSIATAAIATAAIATAPIGTAAIATAAIGTAAIATAAAIANAAPPMPPSPARRAASWSRRLLRRSRCERPRVPSCCRRSPRHAR